MNFEDEKSAMVKLISAEGHVFVVDRRCAMVSGTVKNILQGQFAGKEPRRFVHVYNLFSEYNIIIISHVIHVYHVESRGEVRFPEIPGIILEKLIQYLHYKVRYSNSTQRIPNFHIEPEISMELLMAASYLDC